MTELAALVARRGQFKGQLTRLSTYIKDNVENIDVDQVMLRKEKAKEVWQDYEQIQTEIEEKGVSDETEKYRAEMEKLYYETMAECERIVRKGMSTLNDLSLSDAGSNSRRSDTADSNAHSVTSVVKLAAIDIPKFSGLYSEWKPFFDMFSALVHSNNKLDDVKKFFYLRAALSDDAENAIKCFQTTAESYQLAWNSLVERYNNNKLLVQAHTKSLFELEPVRQESASQLRKLYDSILGHIKSLETLGQSPNAWGSLLIHLIISKLDRDTVRQWEIESPRSEVATIKTLLDFLQTRFRMLEAIESSSSLKYLSEVKATVGMKRGAIKSTSFAALVQFQCYYCKQNHTIYRCQAFIKLSVAERIKYISDLKHCKTCLHTHLGEKCKGRRCAKCGQAHNSLLHLHRSDKIEKSDEQGISSINTPAQIERSREGDTAKLIAQSPSPSITINTQSYICNNNNQILLSTAIVYAYNYLQQPILCRVLLDSGSQNNFITESLAQQLRLKRKKITCSVYGISNSNQSVSYQVSTKLKSRVSDYEVNLNFLVLPKLTSQIPLLPISHSNIKIPEDITLADPSFDTPQRIDMLLGAEIFFDLMSTGQLRPILHGPIFKNTTLGWIVSGSVSNTERKTHTASVSMVSLCNLEEQIARFWQLEEVKNDSVLSLEEKLCKKYFYHNVRRDVDGRYVVSLPFSDVSKLGKSYNTALRRFLSLERRLQSDTELRKKYTTFLNEYLSLGHMELVPPVEVVDDNSCYYIPHHAVHKKSSLTTKLRVVFDASCKTNTGISLNDVLLKGPCIQEELVCIMARFRTYKFVLSADIAKMYRQIWVSVPNRDFQRILWRVKPDLPIQTFRLKTVTYGVVTSSYLATACLLKLFEESCSDFPEACRALRQDFYMDDLLTGANTIENALKIRDELVEILSKAGFELRQWNANETALLKNINTSTSSTDNITEHEKITKLLGVYWNNKNDSYQYVVQHYDESCVVTKRKVLSDIASVFDPLGLISPIIVRLKIMMQRLWLTKIDWDEVLPIQLCVEWKKYRTELESINSLSIDRSLSGPGVIQTIQLHGFADASTKAYGACIYLRTVNELDEITVRLVCSKSRVAPLKVVSLPRLELLAALLLARMTYKYAPILQMKISRKYYWSDSKVVLAWIASESSRWKTFVGHRVGEIQELTVMSEWNHVSTKDNPADIVSRGCEPTQLQNNQLWWEGPEWLSKGIVDWPKVDAQWSSEMGAIPEERNTTISVVTIAYDISILNRYSSLNNLLRVTSYCRRFINNARSGNVKITGPLQADEINNATNCIIKLVQYNSWSEELTALKNARQISPKSKLWRLKPFLDENKLIRVGGRLKNAATLDIFQKHPIPLPADSPFTNLIFVNEHEKTLHGGPQIMLTAIRTKYWPINGRNIARKISRKCVKCFRYKPVVVQPIMGNLPQARIEPVKPFQRSGVDFAGPFQVKCSLRRNAASNKAYACMWVCFVTKAVHIELVGDLTTQSFMNALKRFCDRRGLVSDIYSDNATNFVGANRQLVELRTLFWSPEHQEKLQTFTANNGIRWHFIPPRSPHFGGLWEAAIKSMKSHLFKTLGNVSLTFEELYSVLVRVEAILNSRPITPLSADPSDLTALTPGHFLTGDIFNVFPEEDVMAVPTNRLTRWRRVTQFTQQLWQRWRRDYLSQLQTRDKWATSTGPELEINSVVMIRDDNLPPLQWRIGRVTDVQPGADGVVRVATVRTADGSFKRAVRQLCPLPINP